MKLLEYNSNSCKTDGGFESVLLRIGVLFAQQAIAAGNGISWIDPATTLKTENYQQKIFLSTAISSIAPEFEDKDPKKMYHQLVDYWKLLKAIKHPTPHQINELKKFERNIDKAYDGTIIYLIENSKQMGLHQLKDLIGDDSATSIVDFYATDVFDDRIENIAGNLHKMVNLLQFKFDLGEDTINKAKNNYWLGLDGFVVEPAITKVVKEVFTSSAIEATDMANLYAEPFVTLPNINLLHKDQLLNIRSNLSAIASSFNAVMDEWIKLAAVDAIQSVNYFKSHIRPQFAELQLAIDQDETVQSIYKIKPDEKIELLIGEIYVPLLWDFYFEQNMFIEEIYTELQAAKQTGNWNYRIPFVTIKTKSDFINKFVAQKETDAIKPSKKSLDID